MRRVRLGVLLLRLLLRLLLGRHALLLLRLLGLLSLLLVLRLLRKLRRGWGCWRNPRLPRGVATPVHRCSREQVRRVGTVVGSVRLGVTIQARVLRAPGGGGGSSGRCRGGRRLNAAPDAANAAEGIDRSIPLSVAVGAARLAPGKAHTAAADGGALHVVDDVLGASTVREGNEGAAATRRCGDGVDLAGAGEGVAEDLLGHGVVDATHEDRCVAWVGCVGSCLSWTVW